ALRYDHREHRERDTQKHHPRRVEPTPPDSEEASGVLGEYHPPRTGNHEGDPAQSDADPPRSDRDQEQSGQQCREQPEVDSGTGTRARRGGIRRAIAARSAASTTLASSIARVIGPTPPGFGETHPATSAAAGSTSPRIFPSSPRLTPT